MNEVKHKNNLYYIVTDEAHFPKLNAIVLYNFNQNTDDFLSLIKAPINHDFNDVSSDIFNCYEKINKWMNALTLPDILEGSFDTFFKWGRKTFNNPIALFNEQLHVIYYQDDFKKAPDHTIWDMVIKDSEPDILNYYTTQERLDFQNDMYQKNTVPTLFKSRNNDTYMYCNLFVNDTLFGNLATTDINNPVTIGQYDYFYYIAQKLETFLYYNNYQLQKTNYFDKLITGEDISKDTILSYLNNYGWQNDSPYFIYTFKNKYQLNSPIESNNLIKLLKTQIDMPMYTTRDSIVYIPVKASQSVDISFLQKNNIITGISDTYYHFDQSYLYATQAKYALNSIDETSNISQLSFNDVSVHVLKNIINTSEDYRMFIDSDLLELSQSDDEFDYILLETLNAYLLNGRSKSHTAKAMNVHRNTLIYRLEKLEERLKINFDELTLSQNYHYTLSCMLLIDN